MLEALDKGEAVDESEYWVRLKLDLSDFDRVFRLFCWLRALTQQDLRPLRLGRMTPVSEILLIKSWQHTFKVSSEELFRANAPYVEPFFNLIIDYINRWMQEPALTDNHVSIKGEQSNNKNKLWLEPSCDPELLEDKLPKYDHRFWPSEASASVIQDLRDEIEALKRETRAGFGQFEQSIDAKLDRVRRRMTLIEQQLNIIMYPYTGRVKNHPEIALRKISHTLAHDGEFIAEDDPRISVYTGFFANKDYPTTLAINGANIAHHDCLLTNRRYFTVSDDGGGISGPNPLHGVPRAAMSELIRLGTQYHALSTKLERLLDEKYLDHAQRQCTII